MGEEVDVETGLVFPLVRLVEVLDAVEALCVVEEEEEEEEEGGGGGGGRGEVVLATTGDEEEGGGKEEDEEGEILGTPAREGEGEGEGRIGRE